MTSFALHEKFVKTISLTGLIVIVLMFPHLGFSVDCCDDNGGEVTIGIHGDCTLKWDTLTCVPHSELGCAISLTTICASTSKCEQTCGNTDFNLSSTPGCDGWGLWPEEWSCDCVLKPLSEPIVRQVRLCRS